MLNLYKLRKWGAFLLIACISTISFFIGIQFYPLMWAIVIWLVTSLVFILLANLMIKTPFRDMVEGKGLMVMNLDSTGIIRFSIVGLQSPYIKGRYKNKKIEDVFDRSTVVQVEAPKKNHTKAEKIMEGPKKGGIKIEVDEKEYNDARFALFHWPVLIWNDNIQSLITKEWLAQSEKETFAEHGILYLNRKMEELTGWMRDFGRHVVESTKPKANIFQSKWFWILAMILIIALIALFAGPLIQSIAKTWTGTQEAVSSAVSGGPITPR